MDPAEIVDELRLARDDFETLLDGATRAQLRGATNGTRWTNGQLLFHMLFGCLLVRTLLPLVRAFGRLPRTWSQRFAAALNAVTRPFHVINYMGALGGATVLRRAGMKRLMNSVIDGLIQTLGKESVADLERGMHFPAGWDPYFRDFMTVRDVYHYVAQHYRHHRDQLTLPAVVSNRPGRCPATDQLLRG